MSPPEHSGLCVAKLGGSLEASPAREAWLDAFAAARRPLILVAGGGIRARLVRRDQIEQGFDDAEAHARALRAMEANAAGMARKNPRFALANSRAAIAAALAQGAIPVWLPAPMALAAPGIPASWEMTSDSLAAWLAGVCGATHLLLIKSRDAPPSLSLRALAEAGIVDPLFPRFAAASGARVHIASPAPLPVATALLHNGGVLGAVPAPMASA